MEEIHDLVEDEYTIEARYSMISLYLQATLLFLKEIQDTLNGSYLL